MQSDTSIRTVIEKIAQLPKIDERSVGALFNTRLEAMNDPGNPFINIFIGLAPEESIVENLELRVPKDGGGDKALLILTMKPERRYAISQLRPHLGVPSRVEQPRAAQPLGTPTYEIFDYAGGLLSVGYLPAEGDRISKVIFERK